MPNPHVNVYNELVKELSNYLQMSIARGVIDSALKKTGVSRESLERNGISARCIQNLKFGTEVFIKDKRKKNDCISVLNRFYSNFSGTPSAEGAMPAKGVLPQDSAIILNIDVEDDIVKVRSVARKLAINIGFSNTDQVKIATAVSELARNIFFYAGKGRIEFHSTRLRKGLKIVAKDKGPGIKNIDEILSGNYDSKTGMGLGIRGCKNLMDDFQIKSKPGIGSIITLFKYV